ncbi:MAG: hypothetical protein RSP_21650 [Rhodanobacter sp.]
MNDVHDDGIEALLRRGFDGPIPDGGFSERVMQRLPARRRRIAWPLWGGVLAGVAAGWASLSRSPLLHDGWRDWLHGDWSMPAIALLLAVAGMSLLACGWGVLEAGER